MSSHYYRELNIRRREKFLRRMKIFSIAVILIMLIVAAVIVFDNMQVRNSNTEEVTTSEASTVYFEPKVQIFRTAYFQFQADSSWTQSIPDSTDNKFVYRSKRGPLIEHELVVYVNAPPSKLTITRVLPVNIKQDSELLPLKVSEQCGKNYKGPQPRHVQTLDGVTFECAADSTMYNVIIGQTGGSQDIKLTRPDDTKANYVIYYSNVTATPNATQIEQIISTFQSR